MIGRTNANAGNTAENLNISLKTNQNTHEDLIGTLITIKYSDIEEQHTWYGTDLLVQIPRYAKYTVTFGSVEGYKTPDSFSSTALEKNSVSLEAIYKTELVTINVEGAEGYEISINEISIYNNEYIEVEYIESTGTQYIDTGFKHNLDTRVVMKVLPTAITANAWAFEGRNSTSAARKGVFYYYSSNDLWNTDYPGSRQSISNINDTDLLEIDYNKNVCTINGQSVTHTATTFLSSYNLTLLACNTAGTISGKLLAKLYSCQIYDNDVLIRDYIPVKNSEGVYGLYDKVNNTFSVSAVTDLFVGSEIVHKRNIAVLTLLTDTHKIPYDTEYAIEASNVDGCTTPEILIFTASQITRSVDIVYTKAVENVIVNVSTEDGASVNGVYLRVLTSEGTNNYFLSGDPISFLIVYGETYTVSVDPAINYTTPEPLTYTASLPTRTINMEYTIGMEEVTIDFTSTGDTGVPQGIHEYPLIVEYNDESYEYAISAYQVTFSVSIGTTYTLIYPDVPGYITPVSLTFTAEGETRRIEVEYQEMELGVFIQGVSGKLYDYETWSSQETINGIAVISEECSFVMAPFISTYSTQFNQSGTVLDVTTTTSSDTAILDYKGKANTEAFLNYSGISSSCVAVLCSDYTFNNGKTGYLGAAGEWSVVNANKEAIDDAYERVSITLPNLLWTSTQASSSAMWVYYHSYNNYFGMSSKTSAYAYYIPFTTLNNSSSSEGEGGTNSVSIVWSTISGTWNSNSNSSAVDGVSYTCESPGTDESTVLRCTFSGVSSITFNCVYNGESNYDYLTVGAIDSSCTRSTYGTSLKGKSGTAQNITYNCTTDTHYVEFCYSKDSSVDAEPDNATVYITTYS